MRTCGGGIAVEQVFFRLSIYASGAKIQSDKVVRWCRDDDFLRPLFAASRVQRISDLHSKFALRLRLGEEKKKKKKETG